MGNFQTGSRRVAALVIITSAICLGISLAAMLTVVAKPFHRNGYVRISQEDVVLQRDITDCGVAALDMYLARRGVQVSYGQLQSSLRPDLDGTSIDSMLSEARSHGIDLAVRRVTNYGQSLKAPAIVLSHRHYILIEHIENGVATIVDPAIGRLSTRSSTLTRDFQGLILQ